MEFAPAPVEAPHRLHAPDRVWPETNCYVDLWIELLAHRGLAPEAMLGFTLRQDFEGDHFTFGKPHVADLERLYGIEVAELALYDDLEGHALAQTARGRAVLVEVDGYHLPDTPGTSYRREHTKTTVALLALDPEHKRLDYLHNAGRHALEGEDYAAIFAPAPLFPYAEFVKASGLSLGPEALREAARDGLAAHRARAPRRNPVLAFRDALAEGGEALVRRPIAHFHRYAFNTTRALGANFELLADHLDWLRDGEGSQAPGPLAEAAGACRVIATEAKTFQFQLARAVARASATGLPARLDRAAAAYGEAFAAIDRALA